MKALQSFFILVFLFLLIGNPAYSQTKKGFKFFKKKKYEKAAEAFTKDIEHPLYQSVALFYLAKIKAKGIKKPQSVYMEAYQTTEAAATYYTDLSTAHKTKLNHKKFGKIRATKFKSQRKSIQRKALKSLEASNSIFELDTFLLEFPASFFADSIVHKTRTQIVTKHFKSSNDYLVMFSIYKNHLDFVKIDYQKQKQKQNLRFNKATTTTFSFGDRLLSSFLSTYGLLKIDLFIKNHPNHWVSRDCWINEFIDAYKTESVNALLEFLENYPLTTLNRLAWRGSIKKTVKNENLSPKAQKKWDNMQLQRTLSQQIKSRKTANNFDQTMIAYLTEEAPTERSFGLMKNGLQYYIVSKQWDKATELVELSQPLFPDKKNETCPSNNSSKQRWFNTVLPILRKPHSGISLEAFKAVNTEIGEEHSPVLSADGGQFFYAASSSTRPNAGEDVYTVKYDFETKQWGSPAVVPNLSGEGDQGPLSITSNGDVMLVFVDRKLHFSTLTTKGWSKPKLFAEHINALFQWIGKATFSSNGQVLLFEAIEKIEGREGRRNIDLYVSLKNEKGHWDTPFSLGKDINTHNFERSPFLHLDNETLYFSSNGGKHPKLDNMDVFVTKRLDDTWQKWSKPQNLGKEINTLKHDWGYNFSSTASGHSAYLSSVSDVNYTSDIFETSLPVFARPQVRVPLLITLREENGDPIVGTVVIENLATGEILDKITTRPDGTGTFIPPSGIQVKYYTTDSTLFPISKVVDLRGHGFERIVEEPIQVVSVESMLANGKPAPLNNLMLDSGKYDLKEPAKRDIQKVYHLIANQNWLLEISGHTDNEGGAAHNKMLSLKRAEAVKIYLTELGIAAERLQAKGLGMEQPVANNDSETGRRKNRRVEIRFFEPLVGNGID